MINEICNSGYQQKYYYYDYYTCDRSLRFNVQFSSVKLFFLLYILMG